MFRKTVFRKWEEKYSEVKVQIYKKEERKSTLTSPIILKVNSVMHCFGKPLIVQW